MKRSHEHRIPVIWSREAERDLADIASYIAHDSPQNARLIVGRIRRRTEALRDFPRRGRVVPELLELGISNWREIIIRPYRVIYTVEHDSVEIDVVADSRRDFETLLMERLIQT